MVTTSAATPRYQAPTFSPHMIGPVTRTPTTPLTGFDHLDPSSTHAFGQLNHPNAALDKVFTALVPGSAAASNGTAAGASTATASNATNSLGMMGPPLETNYLKPKKIKAEKSTGWKTAD